MAAVEGGSVVVRIVGDVSQFTPAVESVKKQLGAMGAAPARSMQQVASSFGGISREASKASAAQRRFAGELSRMLEIFFGRSRALMAVIRAIRFVVARNVGGLFFKQAQAAGGAAEAVPGVGAAPPGGAMFKAPEGVLPGVAAGGKPAPITTVVKAGGEAAGGVAAGGAQAAGGAAVAMGPLLAIAGAMLAALLVIAVAIKTNPFAQKTIQGLLKVISLILRPIGDVIGGLFLALIRVMLPLAKIQLMLWRPFQKRIFDEIKKQAEAGKFETDPISAMASVYLVAATEFGKFMLVQMTAVINYLTNALFDVGAMLLEGIILALGAIGGILLGILGVFAPELAAAWKEEWSNLISAGVLAVEVIKKGLQAGIDEAAKGIISSLVSMKPEVENATTESLSIFQKGVVGLAAAIDSAFGLSIEPTLIAGMVAVNEIFKNRVEGPEGIKGVVESGMKIVAGAADNGVQGVVDAFNSLLMPSAGASSALESVRKKLQEIADIQMKGGFVERDPLKRGLEQGFLGAGAGAIVGSVVPGLGTFTGGALGGILGFLKGFLGFQMGGTVPETGLYRLHKGEFVTPNQGALAEGRGGTTNVSITVNASVASDMDIRDLARKLSLYIRDENTRRLTAL